MEMGKICGYLKWKTKKKNKENATPPILFELKGDIFYPDSSHITFE